VSEASATGIDLTPLAAIFALLGAVNKKFAVLPPAANKKRVAATPTPFAARSAL
jgi:hypothetical protein